MPGLPHQGVGSGAAVQVVTTGGDNKLGSDCEEADSAGIFFVIYDWANILRVQVHGPVIASREEKVVDRLINLEPSKSARMFRSPTLRSASPCTIRRVRPDRRRSACWRTTGTARMLRMRNILLCMPADVSLYRLTIIIFKYNCTFKTTLYLVRCKNRLLVLKDQHWLLTSNNC